MRCVNAWRDLSTCRQIGMEVGPIPIDKIWAWCDRRGLDSEAADAVEHVIRQLDVDRAVAERAAAAQKKALGPQRRPGR